MAEPIRLSSGTLALATFALQCSVSLYETVGSFHSHPKRVRNLLDELEALRSVLTPFIDLVKSHSEVGLSCLDLQLLRCGNICKDFQEVLQCASRSNGGRTSFRDWAKLTYMGGNMDDFGDLLAGYKATINIALTDANLRLSRAIPKNISDYMTLIEDTKGNLEARLESIERKLEELAEKDMIQPGTGAPEPRSLRKERLSQVEVHTPQNADGFYTGAANSKSENQQNHSSQSQEVLTKYSDLAITASKSPRFLDDSENNIGLRANPRSVIGQITDDDILQLCGSIIDTSPTTETPFHSNHDDLADQQSEFTAHKNRERLILDYEAELRNSTPEESFVRDFKGSSSAQSTSYGFDHPSEMARNSTQATSIGSKLRWEPEQISYSRELKDLDEFMQEPAFARDSEDDDLASIVTDNQDLTLPPHIKVQYIVKFAEEMYSALGMKVSNDEAERLLLKLPGYLKLFTLQLIGQTCPGAGRDAVTFVRHQRRRISETLTKLLTGDELEMEIFETRVEFTSYEEKIARWKLDLEDQMDSADEEEALSELADFSSYADTLTGSPAYQRLISRIQTEVLLEVPEPDLISSVRASIMGGFSLPSSSQSPNADNSRKARYVLDWAPASFCSAQGYPEGPDSAIAHAIVLIGTPDSAQATTCEEYMCQTWPMSGQKTLLVLQNALISKNWQSTSSHFENLQMRIRLVGATVIADVEGIEEDVVEIGEQLGWMGASLRLPGTQTGLKHCYPIFSQQNPAIGTRTPSDATYNVQFVCEDLSWTANIDSGHCWLPLFGDRTVVKGFPILARGKQRRGYQPGLEIPLNLMAGMAEASRVTRIDGQLLIKGFSTLFIPTKQEADITVWHMIHNEDDSHISYFDIRASGIAHQSAQMIDTACLERTRHILGWCSVVNNLSGTNAANYNIGWSGLHKPQAGWMLEKVSISGGKFLLGGVTFGRGNLDLSCYITRQSNYTKQLLDLSSKFVIFYDVDDHRAWLLNGVNALLHLVRAYLTNLATGRYVSSGFKFRFENMKEPADYDQDYAFKVLDEQHNKNLVIFEDWRPDYDTTSQEDYNASLEPRLKGSHFFFYQQVDETYHILEQVMEFQAKMTETLRLTPRDRLEGFDFMDIATKNLIHPRATHLKQSRRGWVDLVRSLNAVTLFGRDFGELLQPARGSNTLCKAWNELPTGRDLLAAPVLDLAEVIKSEGNSKGGPMKLTHNLFWHKPDKLFEPCQCESSISMEPWKKIIRKGTICDRVQVLLPHSLGQKVRPGVLEPKGAVIFGQSEKYKWYWPIQGRPCADLEDNKEESEKTETALKKATESSSSSHELGDLFSLSSSRTTPQSSLAKDTPLDSNVKS